MHKFRLSTAIERTLYLLIIIIPFLGVISSRLSPIPVSSLKELLQLLILVFIAIELMIGGRVQNNKKSLIVLFIALYFILHLFSLINLTLWVDGARYQLGYMLIAFGLILCRRVNLSIDVIVKILFVQSIVIICIGWVEFFYVDIIKLLYGIDKGDMNNTTLAVGSRLISVMGNPINLGAFTCISLLTFQFMFTTKRINRVIYYTLIVAAAFVCFLTFSRLSLIAFSLLFIFISIRNKDYVVFSAIVLGVFILINSAAVVDLALIFDFNMDQLVNRVLGIFDAKTYSENVRVIHWLEAINTLDNLIFLSWGLGFGWSNPFIEAGGFVIENSFVSVLIETGVFGLLIYVSYILFCFILVSFKKNYVTKPERQFYKYFLVFFIILSLGNDFNRNLPFVFYFWLFTAEIIRKFNGQRT